MTAAPRRPRARTLGSGAFALATGGGVAALVLAAGRAIGWPPSAVALTGLGAGIGAWLLLRGHAHAIAVVRRDYADLEERLASALNRVQTMTNAQGRFVGNIAHELKTPLAIVLAQTELLRSRSGDPLAVRHYAKSIAEDMQHLSDLIESFLRLARPFAQEDRSHHEPVYFHDFVVDAVRRSQSVARESGVTVVATLAEPVDGDAAIEVLGDPVLLEAMVENLVRNAIRFSPRGMAVEVVVEAVAGKTVLFVRDCGRGISPAHLASVFDWFFDPSADAMRSLGTGFGLAIAQRVAEHHGGSITLRNRPTGGCEFEVRLPTWSDPPDAKSAPGPSARVTPR